MSTNILRPRASLLFLGIILILAAAACGGEDPKELAIPVHLKNKALAPDTITVKNGDTVTLQIDSDEAGGLHIHGYDIEKALQARQINELTFVANTEGRFIITFHRTEAISGAEEEHHGEANEEELQVGVLEVHPR